MITKARCKYYCRGCASKNIDGFCEALISNATYEKKCPFYITIENLIDDLYLCYEKSNFKSFEAYLEYLDNRIQSNRFIKLLKIKEEMENA